LLRRSLIIINILPAVLQKLVESQITTLLQIAKWIG
jgi:hypothetical protein